jgi:hypothetical protein
MAMDQRAGAERRLAREEVGMTNYERYHQFGAAAIEAAAIEAAAIERAQAVTSRGRGARRRLACQWLAPIMALLACVPSTGPEPARPVAAPPVEAELRAAPPPSVGAPTAAEPSAASASAEPSSSVPPPPPPPDASLQCVDPPDPELDKESPWSRELGQRLERELQNLRRCTQGLPDGEQELTLRFVYQKDGSPLSQHVVTSTPGACAASECLKQALASVRSPKLIIDKASIDLTLSLSRDATPQRSSGPVDPLTPEETAVSTPSAPSAPDPSQRDWSNGCVDPEVALLSQAKVREVVSTTYPRLQACYGQALARDHHAAGKVTFEFVINQDGAVGEAWAREASLRDCTAIRCMLSEFRTLGFPEPVGRAVRVIYPISYVVEQAPVTLQ